MATDFSSMTAPQASAALFDRIRNRPQPIDPATGQPVVRTHPILDAIKTGGSSLVGQLFTTMGPMLMPFLTKLLQKYMGGIVTPSDATASGELAEDRQLVGVLVAAHGAEAATAYDDIVLPVVQALQAFIIAMLNAVDPKDAVSWLVSLINQKLNPGS